MFVREPGNRRWIELRSIDPVEKQDLDLFVVFALNIVRSDFCLISSHLISYSSIHTILSFILIFGGYQSFLRGH